MQIGCILMVFLLLRCLLFVFPIFLSLLPLPTARFEVLPHLRDHGEGAVQLLFEVCVLILQLRAFKLQFADLSSGLQVEGL